MGQPPPPPQQQQQQQQHSRQAMGVVEFGDEEGGDGYGEGGTDRGQLSAQMLSRFDSSDDERVGISGTAAGPGTVCAGKKKGEQQAFGGDAGAKVQHAQQKCSALPAAAGKAKQPKPSSAVAGTADSSGGAAAAHSASRKAGPATEAPLFGGRQGGGLFDGRGAEQGTGALCGGSVGHSAPPEVRVSWPALVLCTSMCLSC